MQLCAVEPSRHFFRFETIVRKNWKKIRRYSTVSSEIARGCEWNLYAKITEKAMELLPLQGKHYTMRILIELLPDFSQLIEIFREKCLPGFGNWGMIVFRNSYTTGCLPVTAEKFYRALRGMGKTSNAQGKDELFHLVGNGLSAAVCFTVRPQAKRLLSSSYLAWLVGVTQKQP